MLMILSDNMTMASIATILSMDTKKPSTKPQSKNEKKTSKNE